MRNHRLVRQGYDGFLSTELNAEWPRNWQNTCHSLANTHANNTHKSNDVLIIGVGIVVVCP
jgi:hypothetical protein